jgi:hypothetical protein
MKQPEEEVQLLELVLDVIVQTPAAVHELELVYEDV